jgi:hypothetical protein
MINKLSDGRIIIYERGCVFCNIEEDRLIFTAQFDFFSLADY